MTREEHLLVIIAEECSEIAKNATKALRFGLDDCEPGQPDNNATRMLLELTDLLAVFEMMEVNDVMCAAYDEVTENRRGLMDAKIAKVERFFEYSRQKGLLT
jgi:hypothetical protein